jgi:hypothetical protein
MQRLDVARDSRTEKDSITPRRDLREYLSEREREEGEGRDVSQEATRTRFFSLVSYSLELRLYLYVGLCGRSAAAGPSSGGRSTHSNSIGASLNVLNRKLGFDLCSLRS